MGGGRAEGTVGAVAKLLNFSTDQPGHVSFWLFFFQRILQRKFCGDIIPLKGEKSLFQLIISPQGGCITFGVSDLPRGLLFDSFCWKHTNICQK